jgi:hypothetical protein
LSPLAIKIIEWHIHEKAICLSELFGHINLGLAIVLQYGLHIQRYFYMEKDPHAKKTLWCHVMML